MVLSPYLLQPTLNQFPSAPEGSKQDMCRFGVIQAHTVRPSFRVQSGCGTICQSTFVSYLLTVSRLISTASSYLITGLRPVFNFYTALFLSKLLFIVCCMAFSLHICLFTRGAILLGIESAPLSEDEDDKANEV